MNRRIMVLGGLAALMGAGTVYGIHAQTTPVTPPVAGRRAERHPEIRAALRNLNNAARNLEKAEHDFKGHRAKALDLTRQAIAECQAALKADSK